MKTRLTTCATESAMEVRIRHLVFSSSDAPLSIVVVLLLLLALPASSAPGSWAQGADMPEPTSTPASCVADGILYVIGGHYPDADTALRSVWAYDPAMGAWTRKADLPTARHFTAAATVDEIVYVVGGSGAGVPGEWVRPVAAYDPRMNTWTNGADMPTGRGALAVCVVDGIIYAIGGALDVDSETAAVEAYDPKSNQWTVKTPMPQARWFLTASVVNGLIYVFHGTDVFAYDPATDQWTSKIRRFSPYSWGLMSAEVDGIIYLFGGFTEDWRGGYDVTLAYDPAHDQFTARRRMPRTRCTAACGAIEGRVYLAGGVSKEPIVNYDAVFYRSLDVFDPQGGVMPEILSLTCGTTNQVRLVWQGEAGIRCGVESRLNAANGFWARLMLSTGTNSILAANSLVEASCVVPATGTNRFFRVLEVK